MVVPGRPGQQTDSWIKNRRVVDERLRAPGFPSRYPDVECTYLDDDADRVVPKGTQIR